MQQFLRASTYMLPVSMVLANIYQPYKVCLAMFSCYLFQHGLFIWKLFLGISILTVTSFKWQFLCFFVFCQEPRHSNAQCFLFFFFLLHFTFRTLVFIDWVSLLSAHMSWESRLKTLTLSIWGLLPDSCCFSVASKPPLNLFRSYPLVKNLCP